ncbi:MAG TPA: BMP family ABC transporter substrate-binding protein [Candidatus Faecousia intestinigallinarum]|nr:BMP family ABC transporter substrate-binding protein [Candidatus Faecousia intestinigallinarum]
MKKILALLLCLALCLGALAACAAENPAPNTDAPAAPNSSAPAENAPTVALVVAGTFGDRSFYDSSKEGCDRLAAEGVEVKTIECNNENHSQQIYNAADAAEIVVLVGWEFYDVETIAPEYPDVRFIWIDNATSAPVENVLNITYAQNEGSFLAGYIAAKLSQTGVVGAVGGEDTATINDFIVGYQAGAQYANPDVQVEVRYTNTYDDPAVGKECALALHEQGADVVFQIASKAGDGVFEAAGEEGFYAIGVDSDQKYIAPDVIVCSMCKEVGQSIYDAVQQYMAQGDACGLFGTTWVADMASGLVSVGYGQEDAVQQVSDEIKAEVADLAAQIIAGEIEVPTTR